MASCASLKLAYVFMVVTLLRDGTAGRTAARMPGENADAAATQDSRRTERIPIFAVEIDYADPGVIYKEYLRNITRRK